MINNNLSPELEEKLNLAWQIRNENFPKNIKFDIPRNTLPISVTSTNCALNCSHCGGQYLKHMSTMDSVMPNLENITNTSFLISGGCDSKGMLNFDNNINNLIQMKDSGFKLNMHTGLIPEKDIINLSNIADTVSFDFVTDNETIKEVYGTGRTGEDYVSTYVNLKKHLKHVIPHICIGLKGGEISGEYDALDKLSHLGTHALVFIIFIPTPNTTYANCKPPSLESIIGVLCHARKLFPKTPIHLGCMRPHGKYRGEIDYFAVKCGVNKIVNPTSKAIKLAQELELSISYGEECCIL